MELTDALVQGAIDSITGFIVARASKEYGKPVAEMMEIFLASNTYALLADRETGFYWDSLPELYGMFIHECLPTGRDTTDPAN